MRHPFKHPLATHAAMTVLGYRRNGAPIYTIAGGNGEGEGDGGTTPPAPAGDQGTPPAPATQPPAEAKPATGDGDGTDWKTHAREWEKRAKANSAELDKLRKAQMTDQEKAIADAEAKGRQNAAAEYGVRLAGAEFRAAAAAAGVDLGEASDLIDVSRFVKDGEVDSDAIKAAVGKLAKLAPKQPAGRSGTSTPPGGKTTPPPERPRSLTQAVSRHLGGS